MKTLRWGPFFFERGPASSRWRRNGNKIGWWATGGSNILEESQLKVEKKPTTSSE